MIVGYIKLYGHRQNAGASLEITNEIFPLFLGTLKLIGCHELPDGKKSLGDFCTNNVWLNASWYVECILQNLNLCDNVKLEKQDKFWKLRSGINKSDERF